MTSNNGRDVYIREQYYAGRSAIELGVELGLSRSQVHRIVAAGPPHTDDDLSADDDLTADELARRDADEDEYPPPPPWIYCGTELVLLAQGRGEEPKLVECERWITADGRPVNELDMYRWRMYEIHEHDNREGVKAVKADMDRQRREYERRGRSGAATELAAAFISQLCQPAELHVSRTVNAACGYKRPVRLVRIE